LKKIISSSGSIGSTFDEAFATFDGILRRLFGRDTVRDCASEDTVISMSINSVNRSKSVALTGTYSSRAVHSTLGEEEEQALLRRILTAI
jgi:phosphomevalonate kinase